MFEDEEWRIIAELPHYSISNCGRVRKNDGTLEARKLSVSDKGFPIITLYGADSKTRYLRQINKLVADAFLPPPFYSNETAVWHKDGDLTNCKITNLRWDTRARVMAWNDMNRTGAPRFNTPKVKNNRTGVVYASAFACALAEGELEETIMWKVERQAKNMEDDNARYRYIFEGV